MFFVEISQAFAKYFTAKLKNNSEICLYQEKFVFLYKI